MIRVSSPTTRSPNPSSPQKIPKTNDSDLPNFRFVEPPLFEDEASNDFTSSSDNPAATHGQAKCHAQRIPCILEQKRTLISGTNSCPPTPSKKRKADRHSKENVNQRSLTAYTNPETFRGSGNFHVVHSTDEKLMEMSCMKKYPSQNALDKFKLKEIFLMDRRTLALYELAKLAGIPCAETVLEPSNENAKSDNYPGPCILQVQCEPIVNNEAAEKFLDDLFERLGLLYSLNIFVCFDPSQENLMVHHYSKQVVMVDFGGELSEEDLKSGTDLAVILYSTLLKKWSLSSDKRVKLLNRLIDSVEQSDTELSHPNKVAMIKLYESAIRNSYGKELEKAHQDSAKFRADLAAKLKKYVEEETLVSGVTPDLNSAPDSCRFAET